VADTRPECVVLIGLPGAGKTTFYRQRYPAHDHISKDTIPNSANKQVRQDAALRRALAAGRSVIVDNTNVSPADRAAVIAVAREFDARVVGYYIEATTRDAVARNEGRTGRAKVPKVAIFTAAKRLVPPSASEGFDELHTVRALPDGGFG